MTVKRRVHQRTIALLDDIAQHRAAFPEPFQRRHFARVHGAGVASWFQRRVENEQLVPRNLYGKRKYYSITEKTVRILRRSGRHVSRSAARPLGPEAKRSLFAFALYCNPEQGALKTIYRPAFDPELFPQLAARCNQTHSDPLRRKLFYRDGETIGYFVVDRGQARFIAAKVRPKLFDLLTPAKYPEMRNLVDVERFRLTVVTATGQRAEELQGELCEPEPPFPVQVVVFPQLIHLLPKQQSTSTSSLY